MVRLGRIIPFTVFFIGGFSCGEEELIHDPLACLKENVVFVGEVDPKRVADDVKVLERSTVRMEFNPCGDFHCVLITLTGHVVLKGYHLQGEHSWSVSGVKIQQTKLFFKYKINNRLLKVRGHIDCERLEVDFHVIKLFSFFVGHLSLQRIP